MSQVQVKDKYGETKGKHYPCIPTVEIPLEEGEYFSLLERPSTLEHRNPVTLKCGHSTAEIDFCIDALTKGVGGLHVAQVIIRAYSIAELNYLRGEARKLLGCQIIDLAAQTSNQTTLEEATELLRGLINQLLEHALLKQQVLSAKINKETAAVLNERAIQLCNESRFGTRRKDLEALRCLLDDYSELTKSIYTRVYGAYKVHAGSQYGTPDLDSLDFGEAVEILLDTLRVAVSSSPEDGDSTPSEEIFRSGMVIAALHERGLHTARDLHGLSEKAFREIMARHNAGYSGSLLDSEIQAARMFFRERGLGWPQQAEPDKTKDERFAEKHGSLETFGELPEEEPLLAESATTTIPSRDPRIRPDGTAALTVEDYVRNFGPMPAQDEPVDYCTPGSLVEDNHGQVVFEPFEGDGDNSTQLEIGANQAFDANNGGKPRHDDWPAR